MHSLLQDLRFGVRRLGKTPAFTIIAIVTLALGMGAATAIFSVVDAVLLKPLPFRDAGKLLVVWEKNPAENRYRMFVSPEQFRDLAEAESDPRTDGSDSGVEAQSDGRTQRTHRPGRTEMRARLREPLPVAWR